VPGVPTITAVENHLFVFLVDDNVGHIVYFIGTFRTRRVRAFNVVDVRQRWIVNDVWVDVLLKDRRIVCITRIDQRLVLVRFGVDKTAILTRKLQSIALRLVEHHVHHVIANAAKLDHVCPLSAVSYICLTGTFLGGLRGNKITLGFLCRVHVCARVCLW
jgi:hypothetical protein